MRPPDSEKPESRDTEPETTFLGDSDDSKFDGVIRYFLGSKPSRGKELGPGKSPKEDDNA